MGSNEPWKYIQDTIHKIEDYYGLALRHDFEDEFSSAIVTELLEFGYTHLPKTIYARCVDGAIRKGKLNHRIAIDMIASRPVIKSDKMTDSLWETVLTNTDSKYTYCFETQTFHPDIMPTVGLYLMKHECSKRLYDVVLSKVALQNTYGESAKVFDMYIKREKSITSKKDIFSEQLGVTKKEYFAWDYVRETVRKSFTESDINIDAQYEERLKHIAMDKDIIHIDLVQRIKSGMSEEQAIELGLNDSKKYGFKYENRYTRMHGESGSCLVSGVNYNLIMYIKYLAGLEDLEAV